MRIVGLACVLAALGAVAGCESASDRSSLGSFEARGLAAPAVAFVADRVKAGTGAPVHVETSGPFMPYGAAYHDVLVSQLAQAGIPLSPVRGPGLSVRYDVRPATSGGNVAVTTQVVEDAVVVWSDTASLAASEAELVNFVGWTPRPTPAVRPFAQADLPIKPMAVTGPGVADERAERIFRRSLRK